MFNNNKSDFAATIGGFILVGFFALCISVLAFDCKFEFSDLYMYSTGLSIYIAAIGVICGFICLYKAFLTEGFTFILVSVFAYYALGLGYSLPLAIGFLAAFVLVGFMGFREGYLDLAIINGLFAITAFALLGFSYEPKAMIFFFVGLFMLAAAATSLYVAAVEWMSAQDFIQEYEEAVFGCCCDDDCDCDCDDDCECGDECTCHKDD